VLASCLLSVLFSCTFGAIDARGVARSHSPVLGCRRNRSSRNPFSTIDSQLDCGVKRAIAKSQILALAGRDRYCVCDRLVSLAVERNATRSTRAHIADTKQPRQVQARFQWRGRRSPVGAAIVANLTNLLAGGFRNRKTVGTSAPTADPRSSGVGADATDRLVATQWDGSIPNLGHKGHPVLGSRPSCRGRVAPSAFLGAKLLPAQRHTLGFGCTLWEVNDVGRIARLLRWYGGGRRARP
jgi:hypothetical protein